MSEPKRKVSISESGVAKRPRRSPVSTENTDEEQNFEEPKEISTESITIAIFCALSYEAVAVKYSLDEEFICRPRTKKYVYSYGRIGEHKVVIARPHQMGTVKAAQCATAVSQQFPNVRFALMVGIGAGIPSLPKRDVRLGDIAVSIPQDNHPGVIQYDFGKYEQDKFVLKGSLDKPPSILMSADGSLEEDEMMRKKPLRKILREITKIPEFARPDTDDILFNQAFHHINRGEDCSGCEGSSEKKIVPRPIRPHQQPVVHRGLILSGNGVVKNPQDRDRLRREFNDTICFEMEAAGIMDEIPCLVVRGICDYADTHKQDGWHHYAAAVAAAYCKALLCRVGSQDVEETRSMKELIEGVQSLIGGVSEIRDMQSTTQYTVDKIEQDHIWQKLHIVEGASFNSYTGEDEGECLSGTRTELLQEVTEWGSSPSSQCLFWLNGMAGTGKSTISRTVAALFKRDNLLGASFFFKRGEGNRGNAKRLFPTITKELLSKVPQMKPSVKRAIEEDPAISAKSLTEQFNQLLLQPLHDLQQPNQQEQSLVIIIDALDECESEKDIEVILQLLPRVKESKSIHLRFFLTSRPDLPTILGFRRMQNKDRRDLILHEIPQPVIEHDISLFLYHKFSRIQEDHSLSSDWPGHENIQTLVKIAVPLFIFAATVCRFIEDLKWSPEQRLNEFLHDPATTSASEMDRTYLPILNQLLTGRRKTESDKLKQEFHEIIGVIILLASPLSVNALTRFIDQENATVALRVESFKSVLNVPDNPDKPVRILHLSLRDFLLNTESVFRVHEKETHWNIASCCLRVMNTSLKQDICGLSSYGIQRVDIDNQVINQHLPAHLQYSCRYWVYHLEQSRTLSEREVLSFLKQHFLHWLEAMSLIGAISEAVSMINALQSGIGGNMTSEFSDFLYDTKRFIFKYIQITNTAPLQLYCAGLIYSPTESTIRKVFKGEQCSKIFILPQVEKSWSKERQTIEGHSGSVQSVDFSPDSQTVASGSDDGTVKLWNTTTGEKRQTFKGHSGRVGLVAFSPDSRTVASGSDDGTVKLWNTTTGEERQTLKGHSGRVLSVTFSRDSQTVASGSDDGTVKLWNTTTGEKRQTFKGHSGRVGSVAFSPDSQTVASGSDDGTVKLWNTTTGEERQTLKGHSGWVWSVAFSPDGQTVASGSDDGTIKLWNTTTGEERQTFKGHSGPVLSVAFSPDGQTVASGSFDRTVKLWDTTTGKERQTLKGHSGWVLSVAFSPDGQTVVSGSDDCTIKLWNTTTGEERQTLKGHSGWVWSVAFSPDGQTVASGSDDCTQRAKSDKPSRATLI